MEGLILKLQYSGHLMRRADLWKRPWCWERWRQEEKGTTEDEMAGWHHWLDEHVFEQTMGDGEGQGSLACCSPRSHKDWTRLSNWTTTTKSVQRWLRRVLRKLRIQRLCGHWDQGDRGGRRGQWGPVSSVSQRDGTSLVVRWLRICLSMQGALVQPLVRKLRPHVLWGNSAHSPQWETLHTAPVAWSSQKSK